MLSPNVGHITFENTGAVTQKAGVSRVRNNEMSAYMYLPVQKTHSQLRVGLEQELVSQLLPALDLRPYVHRTLLTLLVV